MNRLKASIDLGTNTARLLVGRVENGKVIRHHVSRRITRLGGGFTRESGISPDASERTISAMKEFAAIIKEYDVCGVRAVATSAVRDAKNGTDFCNEVRSSTGIELEVISGEEEGHLTLSGIASGIDTVPEYMIVFDVGGGSTEYTLSRGGEVLFTRSLPLGVVRLTEGKSSVESISEKIDRELKILESAMELAGVRGVPDKSVLIATAGTATTLAAIDIGMEDYDYSKVNNHIISDARINEIFERLIPLSPEERLECITGLEEGREDLIVAGTILTLKSMKLFGKKTLKVVDFGLLEGVLLSLE